jgi:suppressor for copper-sensitivity B
LRIDDGWHVNANPATLPYLIPTEARVEVPPGWQPAHITYPASVQRTFAFETEPLDVYEGTVEIPIQIAVPPDARGAVAVAARLRYQACSDRVCLPPVTAERVATLEVTTSAAAVAPDAPAASAPAAPRGEGLLTLLALGFLGGVILNAMPCVLPVLSLKVFSLVRGAAAGRRETLRGGLATSAGILVSFWGLALAAVAAKSAGAAVGWGVQFQEPRFVAFLAVVVVLFCLNLWGVFEIQLPAAFSRGLDRAQDRSGEGVAGHFASGLFATLMATPCSAPFLGTAVGFALASAAPTIFAVFTAVGIGMALPYLILAAAPGALRWLPRPGAWMETLKVTMGFLLAGAAVWLFYVLAGQVPAETLALVEIALLALALLAWLRGRSRRTVTRATLALLLLVTAAGTVWVARADTAPERRAAGTVKLIEWQPWDEARAIALAANGSTVVVDVTADWCFTCKVNERLVLETEPVAAAFRRAGVVAMKADWTNRNDAIAAYLAKFGRPGIPFYAVYRPGAPPKVLPEILTRDLVLEAVAR